MTTYEVVLQRRDLISADVNVGQFAEAGGYTVHRAVFVDDRFDDATRSRHSLRGIGMQGHALTLKGDFIHVLNGERLSVDQQRVHTLIIL